MIILNGQTLVQFLDISSRPMIMDPASAMGGMLGVVAPDPTPDPTQYPTQDPTQCSSSDSSS